ncbi:hypothetical protein GMMP15_880007 [Candidatus Magnetomoraceae bacterium gMMP-15]
MFLPEKHEKLFWQDLSAYEEEKKMPYITSVERIGFNRGIQQGIQQGIQNGEYLAAAKLIARRFRSQPENELTGLKKLRLDDLPELSEQLFVFDSLDAVHEWINKRIAGNA